MSRGTRARNVRIGDPLWRAAKYLAEQEGADTSAKIRELLAEWIAGKVAADPRAAGAAAVRLYLDGDGRPPAGDQVDEYAAARDERFPRPRRAG